MKRILSKGLNNKGAAIITVILIISILVAAGLELNRASRLDVHDAANLSDGIRLAYVAKSGFYGAAALVLNARGDYDSLREAWANAEVLSAQSTQLFTHAYFIVRVEDEKGKIPLNKLVEGSAVNAHVRGLLVRLLSLPEFGLDEKQAGETVDAIIDWIDANDEVTGAGAEGAWYEAQAFPYTAKNAPLDCIEELLMIRGITGELYAGTRDKPGLAQYVTIYGTGAININTAPKMVLRALSDKITADIADKMDEYRKADGNDLSSVLWYKRVSGLENETIEPNLIENLKSDYFRIVATGVADNMEQTITGVIKRSPFQIVYWRLD
ncbi:MAG: type II secretion system minor pseudopilin GspK [Smithellaceae bacterium]